ncbi:fungal-specific transcription factor domain-containing protein [Lipomyces kononenkoae]
MDQYNELSAVTTTRKRRRGRLVCNTCRDRKTRCNGERPACSSCLRRGVGDNCEYEDISIDARRSVTPRYSVEASARHSVSPRSMKSTTGLERMYRLGSRDTPDITSSTGHMAAQVSDTELNDPVYGGSSTNLLVSHVQLLTADGSMPVDRRVFPSLTSEPGNQLRLESTTYGLEIIHGQDISNFVLPHRQAADEFLGCYWAFIHPIFPVLHKQTFLGRYEKLWMPANYVANSEKLHDSVSETIFHTSLNVVFALGCQFSTNIIPAKKISCADELYQRSRKLINFEILDSGQLSVVQMLLLTGIYLQSTEHATRLWNVVGLAIRAAQGLGLHSNEASVHLKSQLDREMCRRVWHTCVLLDRLIAMTFGRPTMISGSWDVIAPSMIDDEHLRRKGEGIQPPNSPSQMGLFVYSLKLFDITNEILSELYIRQSRGASPDEPCQKPWSPEQLLKVLSISSKLDRFDDTLPDSLRPGHLSGAENEPWYLYIRILLLRFILLGFAEKNAKNVRELSTAEEPRLERDFAVRACTLCVSTAHILLDRLQESLNTPYRSPGWHTVYFAFAAATVLIAGHICPLVQGDLADQSFQLSWSRCISILNHHQAQIESAGRAIIVLEALKERAQGMTTTDSWGAWAPPIQGQSAYLAKGVVTETSTSGNLGVNGTQCLTPDSSGPDGMNLLQYEIDTVGMGSMNDSWFLELLGDLDWLNTSR